MHERSVRIHGDGHQSRPFIDVEVLANALCDLVFDEVESQTINLATVNASVNEIADALQSHLGRFDRTHVSRDLAMQSTVMTLPVPLANSLQLQPESLEDSLGILVAHLKPFAPPLDD